jgi:hypothetical protein
MHVGLKIGLAALGGAAAGTAIGFVGDEPSTASGAAMSAAGAGTMGLFGGVTARGGPFTSQGFGLLGVGIGALWAGMGVTTLLRANNDEPVKPQYNPVDHPIDIPTPARTTLPEPAWKREDYDPLRTPSPSAGPAPSPLTGRTTGG